MKLDWTYVLAGAMSAAVIFIGVKSHQDYKKRVARAESDKIAELVTLSQAVDAMASGRDYELRAMATTINIKSKLRDKNSKLTEKDLVNSLIEVNTNLVYSNQEYRQAAEILMAIQKFPSDSTSTNTTKEK